MVRYSGFQYLLIDCANHFGLDKLLFEERIEWAKTNLDKLESLQGAESPILFAKAVMAIRKAQAHEATGHLVAMDACCSGLQIMSALTGCESGAYATGLVDPDLRADAYTETTSIMSGILGNTMAVERADVKSAVMTAFYGSKLTPIKIFGEDTPALTAFYQAVQQMAPGAYELLQDLLNSWQPFTLAHEWVLPDGFNARVKVMDKQECRIEVDELDHATFTYNYYENQGTESGLANAANVVHSIDAYILREIIRRCNYNVEEIYKRDLWIETVLLERALGVTPSPVTTAERFVTRMEDSGTVSVRFITEMLEIDFSQVSTADLKKMKGITSTMLEYKPFPVITIHDSFATHANNVNWVRHWYKEVLAELADSEVLSDIFTQLHGTPGTYQKLSNNLSEKIRQSNYALS